MTTLVGVTIKVADEVWVATALLHRENPSRTDFTINEIVSRARAEAIAPELRPGIRVHALQHCVGNRPPSPGRYRMLFATGKSTRRLFRPSDPSDPNRYGSKTVPDKSEIPPAYQPLLAWYESEYARSGVTHQTEDSILRLRGLGSEIWNGVDADSYVRQLRKGWE